MSVFTYNAFKIKRDKIILCVTAILLSIYMVFSCSYFACAADSVRKDVVRLHILANSDSKEDQAVKLAVRDALLKTNAEILQEGVTTENVDEHFINSREILTQTAKEVLKEHGFTYDVTVCLTNEYFSTRQYGDLIFPAGEYTSLKVILGEGNGQNWWCVMFPPLCVPAADNVDSDENKTADYLTQSGDDLIKGGNKYIVKFKLVELYESLFNKIKE